MKTYKYILLDAANTLIHKPKLWANFLKVLENHGYAVSLADLKLKHKLVSELITFPDVTSHDFYNEFNTALVYALGIVPNQSLLDAVFLACKNLPWEPFDDVLSLNDVTLPLGVLSNFSLKLPTILSDTMGDLKFKHIFVSEAMGIAKPSPTFFQKAINTIGLPPTEILYVGDSMKLDIAPALALGMQVKLIDRDETYPSSNYRIKSLKNLN